MTASHSRCCAAGETTPLSLITPQGSTSTLSGATETSGGCGVASAAGGSGSGPDAGGAVSQEGVSLPPHKRTAVKGAGAAGLRVAETGLRDLDGRAAAFSAPELGAPHTPHCFFEAEFSNVHWVHDHDVTTHCSGARRPPPPSPPPLLVLVLVEMALLLVEVALLLLLPAAFVALLLLPSASMSQISSLMSCHLSSPSS